MAHHAYYLTGDREEAIETARAYGAGELNLSGENNADLIVERYGLLSVDDARRIIRLALQAPLVGEQKLLVICVERFFHEAQNALLKIFEEPPESTTLILVIPSEGDLLPTLRSRLLRLSERGASELSPEVATFIKASASEREKLITKLLDRIKSDKEEEKQAARGEALRLVEGCMTQVHGKFATARNASETRAFLSDMNRFLPILHERSAPYKLIFEHLQLTMPKL
ncbi:MAG: hypothetical protein AAB472_02590 [Patescibacteria group bacterium]